MTQPPTSAQLPPLKRWADLAERATWTLLQAGIGEAIVLTAELPSWLVIPIAGAIAAIKAGLAQKFSVTGSAATLPVTLDPAADPGPPFATQAG